MDFFNSDEYLEIEARRIGGSAWTADLRGSGRTSSILREIGTNGKFDTVSVYGHPDLVQGTGAPTVDLDEYFEDVRPQALAQGIVAAYFRIGLTQTVSGSNSSTHYRKSLVGESVAMRIDRPWDEIFADFRPRLRTQIRKDGGLEIGLSDDVKAFHEIYTQTMSRVDAGKSYFFSEQYLSEIVNIENARLLLVNDAEGPIGGAIIVFHGDRIYYHLGGTSDRGLAAAPMRYIFAWVAREYANRDHRWFVLGGGVGGADDSLMRFKQGFSKFKEPVYALRAIFDVDAYRELSGLSQGGDLFEGFFPAYRNNSPS